MLFPREDGNDNGDKIGGNENEVHTISTKVKKWRRVGGHLMLIVIYDDEHGDNWANTWHKSTKIEINLKIRYNEAGYIVECFRCYIYIYIHVCMHTKELRVRDLIFSLLIFFVDKKLLLPRHSTLIMTKFSHDQGLHDKLYTHSYCRHCSPLSLLFKEEKSKSDWKRSAVCLHTRTHDVFLFPHWMSERTSSWLTRETKLSRVLGISMKTSKLIIQKWRKTSSAREEEGERMRSLLILTGIIFMCDDDMMVRIVFM